MESDLLLVLIAASIVFAAVISAKSGVASAFIEIFAGLILGIFFHHQLPESIHVLSELGLITLMFIAGLEVDFTFIREKGKQGVKLGFVTFVLSFCVLMVFSIFVLQLTPLQSFVVAVALSECSAGMVYPVLRQKGRLGPRRKIILSAVMIMEFMGIALISVAFAHVSWHSIIALIFLIAVWKLYPLARKKYRSIASRSSDTIALKVILAILLAASFLASTTGIDAVLLVFILGMLLAHYVGDHRKLRTQIETISFGFLTPIFFFAVGFDIAISRLFSEFPTILLLSAVAFVTTFIISYIPAKKFLPKRAVQTGFLLNAPMSVGIIAATIGLDRGAISHELYITILGAVILSSFVALVFTRYPQQMTQITEQD